MQQNSTCNPIELNVHWNLMHGETQCTPLILLGEQCHALNSTMLAVSTCSCVSQGGEVLGGFGAFVLFIFMCA
jgi:hypothetical protein